MKQNYSYHFYKLSERREVEEPERSFREECLESRKIDFESFLNEVLEELVFEV